MRPGRVESLDALRGLAILGMAWSGMLPDTLPPWMYHAQLPPPDHVFDPTIYGLTWVDLVFPFFLFSMGAAIPLALTSRLERGERPRQLVLGLFLRGLLLAGFAVFGQHLRVGEWASPPDTTAWLVGVAGFFLLVSMFLRWPERVPKKAARALTAAGWILATCLISWHIYPDGKQSFENSRNDVILMVLANVAVSGGVVWLFTRCRPLVRIGLMSAVALILLTSTASGSLGKLIWDYTPLQHLDSLGWTQSRFFPIFYHFEYHKYLLIVLPGTFCGDLLLRYRSSEPEDHEKPNAKAPCLTLIALTLASLVIACWGLFARAVLPTSLALIVCAVLVGLLADRFPGHERELLMPLSRWGGALIFLGLLAEPIGGGIRKDSPTLSYFFMSAGLAFFLLIALFCLVDVLPLKRVFKLVTMTGANPILGYIVITNLVMGLAGLVSWSDRLAATGLADHPWATAFIDGGLRTLMVALVTATFTKYKLFLRT